MTPEAGRGRQMRIGGTEITDGGACFVIAEIGHNHQGSMETARALIKAAADAGADAVKLQKRDNRTLYTREMYDKPYENENSYGRTYGEHREYLEFGAAEFAELQAYAGELGVIFFSTAFDLPSVEFLEALDVPAYKVASADVTNVPLLRALAQTGRPVLLSTGGAALEDIVVAHDLLAAGGADIAVLQCTAGYPAAWDELDLRVIAEYRDLFPDALIGFSSHDNGIAMPVAAYVLGARIVEKHFTLDRTMRGTDHKFSLEPQGLRKLVRDLGRTRQALGDGTKRVHHSERAPITKMAKKLVAARPLAPGHVLTEADVAVKSPGDGLSPMYWDEVIGARLTEPLDFEEPLQLALLEPPEVPVPSGRLESASS
ncbi:N-acetylneuraminate synthase family protein [Svornostia abyssi]|uniref:N-acetylneuraminate synthase family protein n=1 Tax=Svornostia abyssi TaxID=2898438 RepID=A0ABY5PM74_9ACTN|nr:N-acetylneuraminate synthase family protein [Parviterribacteraceae bacterium J379]